MLLLQWINPLPSLDRNIYEYNLTSWGNVEKQVFREWPVEFLFWAPNVRGVWLSVKISGLKSSVIRALTRYDIIIDMAFGILLYYGIHRRKIMVNLQYFLLWSPPEDVNPMFCLAIGIAFLPENHDIFLENLKAINAFIWFNIRNIRNKQTFERFYNYNQDHDK